MNERRIKILWVRPEAIMTLLHNWKAHDYIALPVMDSAEDTNGNKFDIPRDCYAVRATFDLNRNAIGIMLTHGSWDEVPDGEIPPSIVLREVTVNQIPIVNADDDDTPIILKKTEPEDSESRL